MTTTQQHLNQFYVELQAWIDGGCEEHDVFYPRVGLCQNLRDWCRPDFDLGIRLVNEMAVQFGDANLNPDAPFDGGMDGYIEAGGSNRFTNPARLAWIKAHADAAKAAGQEAA